MITPAFISRTLHKAWQRKGLLSTALLPLSLPVLAATAYKRRRYQRRPDLVYHSRLPVVVVGNIYLGGTGKTPVVIALIKALQERGWRPGVISRGYGVKVGDQARAGTGNLAATEFGDEPALIARTTMVPVSVHPSRVLAIKRLQKSYPEVNIVIADDGLQHLVLGRDIEIVVQDARGIGNGRVMPAGPLREPASRLQSVDYLISNLHDDLTPPAGIASMARQLSMRLTPDTVTHLVTGASLDWASWHARHGAGPISAVAAIGQPERFFSMLRAAGITLDRACELPDHDPYETSPFTDLTSPHILITPKDAVKCERFNDPRLWVVHPVPTFSDPDWLDSMDQMLRFIAAKKQTMAAQRGKH
ncbi:tetraacyldisaccharide 4'-kinase [Pollutimonas nitritireducens]|uniref:tetraacyldisaccharide 4'-kinase n=1 Tax=Pollutimonas nitritireducens TaxID=2045209 RepID=UPI001E2FD248|nr:tetraacyldisaccharide 4'-kinase [Pollutimonas nitritireducens]